MDKALKQRLVGASVLIILAVIVLPMLLGGRSDTLKQESRQIELPTKPEELSFETRRFPVGVPDKPMSAKAQAENKTDVGNAQTKGVAQQEKDGAVKSPVSAAENNDTPHQEDKQDSTAKRVAKSPAVTTITLNSGPDKNVDTNKAADGSQDTFRYLVQVASFSNEKNANALASQLRADHLPILMDVVDRAAGRLHRVRVGPYAERSDADAVVSGISLKMKDLTPRVLDLRPAESAPVSNPSDPLVRWVVQVGSFSSAISAEALVAELRLAGLTAFSEKVSSATATAYKVRVGPEIDRDKAMELARKVKLQHPDAFVTTQD